MPLLHVCTVASHKTKGLAQLVASSERQGITLKILGMGQPFRGCGDKFLHVQSYLETLPDDDVLLFVDGYDVLLMARAESILDTFLHLKASIVASAERNCFPDSSLASQHPASTTSFRYLNSGTYIGYVKALKAFFQALLPIKSDDNDQDLMMRYFLAHQEKILLDTGCALFLPLHSLTHEELVFDKKNCAVQCVETKSYPCIIHGNNHALWYQYAYNNLFCKNPVEEMAKVAEDKVIFLSILAKDNAHLLPKYLRCIEELDYDNKAIIVYIHVQKSQDNTKEILEMWASANMHLFGQILFEYEESDERLPIYHQPWLANRFKIGQAARNKSLKKAQELHCHFYFAVDCDTFIAPYTLKELMGKDKPIIAPLLRTIPESDLHTNPDYTSNFFYDVNADGTFKDHENYFKILEGVIVGTFQVPLVFGTYLIRASVLNKLSFSDDTKDPDYMVLAKFARQNSVDQYICNEKNFGTIIHFTDYLSPEQISVLKAYFCA